MRRTRTWLRDPFIAAVVLLTVLVAGGVLMLALAWKGSAALVRVSDQLPYLVSGGLGGLALAAFALSLLAIQRRRWLEAQRRARFERVVQMASEVLDAVAQDDGERRS
jgi:hypothetical protein